MAAAIGIGCCCCEPALGPGYCAIEDPCDGLKPMRSAVSHREHRLIHLSDTRIYRAAHNMITTAFIMSQCVPTSREPVKRLLGRELRELRGIGVQRRARVDPFGQGDVGGGHHTRRKSTCVGPRRWGQGRGTPQRRCQAPGWQPHEHLIQVCINRYTRGPGIMAVGFKIKIIMSLVI